MGRQDQEKRLAEISQPSQKTKNAKHQGDALSPHQLKSENGMFRIRSFSNFSFMIFSYHSKPFISKNIPLLFSLCSTTLLPTGSFLYSWPQLLQETLINFNALPNQAGSYPSYHIFSTLLILFFIVFHPIGWYITQAYSHVTINP